MCFSADLGPQDPKIRLIAILAGLKHKERLQREAGEQESALRLSDLVAAAIAPCTRPAGDHDAGVDEEHEFEETARRSREVAVYGLEILRICNDDYAVAFSHETILTLISLTDTWAEERLRNTPYCHFAPQTDPWTTPEASERASLVLEKQLSRYFTTETLVVKVILQDYLRPLFSKSRPSAVTASGRKAEFQDEEDARRGLRDEIVAKPWKYADHRAIAVFRWAVHEANASCLFARPFDPASQILD